MDAAAVNARSLRELALRWVNPDRDDQPAPRDAAVLVQVLETRGSTPREVGACLLVRARDCFGTIGGGHLEWQAIARARALLGASNCVAPSASLAPALLAPALHTPAAFARLPLAGGWLRESIPLGPSLGQCCGGAVVLGYRTLDARALSEWHVPAPLFHLHLYGAGHVGRALARQISLLDVLVDWFDEREAMFDQAGPVPGAATIRRHCVDGIEAEASAAPAGAFHLVATHSHDLDLRIAEAILRRNDHRWFGLIGSGTKRARFERRLLDRGLAPDALKRMVCPIGIDALSSAAQARSAATAVAASPKAPEIIALAAVAQMTSAALGA